MLGPGRICCKHGLTFEEANISINIFFRIIALCKIGCRLSNSIGEAGDAAEEKNVVRALWFVKLGELRRRRYGVDRKIIHRERVLIFVAHDSTPNLV